jgi:hypothetical protein
MRSRHRAMASPRMRRPFLVFGGRTRPNVRHIERAADEAARAGPCWAGELESLSFDSRYGCRWPRLDLSRSCLLGLRWRRRLFQRWSVPGSPAVASVGRGSTAPVVFFRAAGRGLRWSARRECLEAADRGGDSSGPRAKRLSRSSARNQGPCRGACAVLHDSACSQGSEPPRSPGRSDGNCRFRQQASWPAGQCCTLTLACSW